MVGERIKAIFAEVFQVDPARLGRASSPADIEGWDSFGHLALVDALQTAFNVRFELDEIAQLDTVGAVEELLARRVARS